jgi:endoglucanase
MSKAMRISAAICFISIIGCAFALRAEDIFEANRALGRGINLGNALEVPKGQDWGFTLKMEHFKVIKDAGFDHVRVPVRWSDYAAKSEPFTIDPAWFTRIDKVLDECEKQKLRAVLNVHHYDEIFKAPREHLPRLKAIWKQIAERYAKREDALYFEFLNEPHEALTAEIWNDFVPQLLAIVRESNPARPVIVGPGLWNNVNELKTLKLPDDKNLIVTVHYYLPHDFTHQGTPWSDERLQKIVDLRWPQNAGEEAQLKKDFELVAKWAKEHQRPIYVGEFGVYEKAPMESRGEWTRAVAEECEKHGFSFAYWEFGAGFGAYDPKNRVWRKPLLEALIRNDKR